MRIERVLEKTDYWSWNNSNLKTGEVISGNLSLFCRTVKVDERIVRSAVQKARIAGKNVCKIGDWVVRWFYIDDTRAALTKKKVSLCIRDERFRVWTPVDPKQGDAADQTFHGLLVLQGER